MPSRKKRKLQNLASELYPDLTSQIEELQHELDVLSFSRDALEKENASLKEKLKQLEKSEAKSSKKTSKTSSKKDSK